MIARNRRFLLTVLCLCVVACAPVQRESAAGNYTEDEGARRQLLVMLRMPAPHFRPDLAYGSNYAMQVGQEARTRIAEAIANEYGLRVIDNWPMPALGVDCFVMQVERAEAPALLAKQLAADPRVESAQVVNLFTGLAYNDPLYPLQPSATAWHLSDLHQITTGKHVRIAQVDSGVAIDHPDLSGQIALARDFVGSGSGDGEQHGTAVAGIIAARPNNGIGIAGIAPEATLLALRACWEGSGREGRASCSSFTLAKALQFAIDENAEVINLSIGGPRDRLLERLLDVALSRGVTIVAAVEPGAGNSFPASHRGVLAIAVAGAQDSGAAFLAAPGQDVPTTLPGRKWGFVSGSSFAAAHVTGLVALLRALSPGLQPQQLRQALAPQALSTLATDRPLTVDACAAVAKTAGTCACACAAAGHAHLQAR